MAIGRYTALVAAVTGLGLLVFALAREAQLAGDLLTSLLFAALMVAWPCASATNGRRLRR